MTVTQITMIVGFSVGLTCWALPWEYICWAISKCQGHHKSAHLGASLSMKRSVRAGDFWRARCPHVSTRGFLNKSRACLKITLSTSFEKETASRVQQDSGCQWFPSPRILFSNGKAHLHRGAASGSPMHFPAQLVDSPQLVGHLQIREFTPPGLQKMELQMPSPHFSVVSSLPVSLS